MGYYKELDIERLELELKFEQVLKLQNEWDLLDYGTEPDFENKMTAISLKITKLVDATPGLQKKLNDYYRARLVG